MHVYFMTIVCNTKFHVTCSSDLIWGHTMFVTRSFGIKVPDEEGRRVRCKHFMYADCMQTLFSLIMVRFIAQMYFFNLFTPTAVGLIPLSDQFNTAVVTGDENVKCGYLNQPYDFECWTSRDVKAGEEVRDDVAIHVCRL